MTNSLIAPRFLFRFTIPCRRKHPLWTDAGTGLDESFRLPWLAELDGLRPRAEVRAAWSEAGLVFQARVDGKRQPPWCRDARPDESDGLRIWLDTRDARDIHRATRFCHQFIFMPSGSGRSLDDACGEQILINRAKEHPKPIPQRLLQAKREKRIDGYVLEAFIPAAALTGFDPLEHPRIGFTYCVVDRELGDQPFNCPSEFPYRDDPSLWATLEMVSAP